ncbi:MAG: nucleotide exchange factor GrpE [Planctomycetota bacterium]
MSDSESNIDINDAPETSGAAELSDEERGVLEERIASTREQLLELASERDAVLSGLDDIRQGLGEAGVRRALEGTGFADGGALDDLTAKLAAGEEEKLRVLAELQNFRRRAAQSEQQARQQGQRSAVQQLLGVLDHFDLTLTQIDPEQATAASVLEGVKLIRDETVRILGGMGVAVIKPKTGEAFEPGRHTAIMQQPTSDAEPGQVVHLARAGYAIGEQIIRPAEVVVAAEPVEEGEGGH